MELGEQEHGWQDLDFVFNFIAKESLRKVASCKF